MTSAPKPSQWAVEQFGDDAAEVVQHVINGLMRGQRSARTVQAAAEGAGAGDRRAYGSMWAARYQWVVEQFELAQLPGYQPHTPKATSYSLAVVNGRVLIPFRHATSLAVPINRAKLSNRIPLKVSRDNGVEPAPTLFDVPRADEAKDPSLADAAVVAQAEKLEIIYVAYVANADSDEVLAAWWGTPISLEDDGTMVWSPEQLDMSIADQRANKARHDVHAAAVGDTAPSFAEGDPPPLEFTALAETTERPMVEPEPLTPEAEDGDA